MRSRRWFLAASIVVAAALLFTVPAADAAKYPNKPIKVIVALGAGGSHDLNARAVASVSHTYLGQPMVVQLMPGGGGKIGMSALKRAPADGYTVMMASSSHLTVSPHVRNMGYDAMNDFIPVFMVTKADYMMVSLSKKPWKNLDQFVKMAKDKPGKISYGSSGIYGVGHLMILKLMSDKKIKLNHVPFKGGGPAFRAMMGGHVDTAGALPATGGTLGRYKKGQLTILGVCAVKRNPLFPKVPTMKEQGVDFVLASKRFFIVKKGTPQDRIDVLVNGLKKLVKDKTYNRLLKRMGEKATPLYGDALVKDIRAEYKNYGAILKSIGVKVKK